MNGVASAKPYGIAKCTVWKAYQLVKANRGAAGIDDETIDDFEQDLSKNLYKLWNRMSSGSYHPPPVKQVQIPKASGGTRKLGVPTVADRVAQTVVKLLIEPKLDPIFHPDSYGYRPGRSAKQAVAVTRGRCWRYDWVVEFDIQAAFDQIDHRLLMKAVRAHIKEGWILLYIERWLVAPFETESGVLVSRERGTPQGGVVSPILMNLFMHYAFDAWMQRRIQGWWQYYGAFYATVMLRLFQHIDRALERWARRKFRALHGRTRPSAEWLDKMRAATPLLFHHWRVAGRQVG